MGNICTTTTKVGSPCEKRCLQTITTPIKVSKSSCRKEKFQIDFITPMPSSSDELLVMISSSFAKAANSTIYRYNIVYNVFAPVLCEGKQFRPIAAIIDLFCTKYATMTVKRTFAVLFDGNACVRLIKNVGKDNIAFVGDLYQTNLPQRNDFPVFLSHFFCIVNTKQWVFVKVKFFKGQQSSSSNNTSIDLQHVVEYVSSFTLPQLFYLGKKDVGRRLLPLKAHGMEDIQQYKNFIFGMRKNNLHCWKLVSENTNKQNENNDLSYFLQYIGKMEFISQNSQDKKKTLTMCIIPDSHSTDNRKIIIIKCGTDIPIAPFIGSFSVISIEFDAKFERIIKHCQLKKEEIYEKFGFNLTQNKQFCQKMEKNSFHRFQCEYITRNKAQYLLLVGGATCKVSNDYGYAALRHGRFGDALAVTIFNFGTREWTMKTATDITIPNEKQTLLSHYTRQIKSIKTQETESIFIMNGCSWGDQKNNLINSSHNYKLSNFKLLLSLPMAWDVERLFWIAYHKNYHNENCLLTLLNKDIVIYILKMCKWSLFDSVER